MKIETAGKKTEIRFLVGFVFPFIGQWIASKVPRVAYQLPRRNIRAQGPPGAIIGTPRTMVAPAFLSRNSDQRRRPSAHAAISVARRFCDVTSCFALLTHQMSFRRYHGACDSKNAHAGLFAWKSFFAAAAKSPASRCSYA